MKPSFSAWISVLSFLFIHCLILRYLVPALLAASPKSTFVTWIGYLLVLSAVGVAMWAVYLYMRLVYRIVRGKR